MASKEESDTYYDNEELSNDRKQTKVKKVLQVQ